jgi:hypothetical protein
VAAFLSGHVSGVLSKDAPRRRDSSVVDNLRIVKGELDEICIDALSYLYILHFGELSSLLTVKTLTGMTTDVYPRENCIAPAIVLIVWTTNTKK